MMGFAATMVSPSSSSATRSTPWVEGCWGPMLRVMVSLRTGLDLPRRELLEVGRRLHPVRRVVGERDLLVAERRILAQRPADPVLGQQDAREARVARERDAVEVEGLALVPVRRGPHAGHRGHARMLARQEDLDVEARVARQREQAVDDLEA